MKHITFNKKRLAVAMSMLLGSGMSLPGHAQEAETATPDTAGDVEIISVRGIKGSMLRAADLKRGSAGVVDAISAEEMGKFPDTNLAESLQRITGVSVSRANGEGSQITVRGFGPDFNLITLNGRSMPGTGNSRSYDLANLSAEGVSTLEVYKTAKADVPSGGLGATVNIVTSKPLNSPGLKYSVSGKGIYDSSNVAGDDITPEFAAVLSNTFADDRFGVALSFSQQRRDFQQQGASIQGWKANTNLPTNIDTANAIDPRGADHPQAGKGHFPQDVSYGFNDTQRSRTNGQLTLQYAFTDDFIATVDYTGTRVTTASESVGWGLWYGSFGGLQGYELDANGTVIAMDIRADDASWTASRVTTEVEADSVGLNLEWHVNDDWKVALDYHDSSNQIDNGGDDGLGGWAQQIFGTNRISGTTYDFRTGDIPQILASYQNGTNEVAPGEIDSNFGQFIHSPGQATVEQARFDVEWINPHDFPMLSLTFGAAYTDQVMSGFRAWSGLRGGSGFNPSFAGSFPDGMFIRNSTDDFLDEFAGGGSDLATNYYYTYDFEEALARSQANLTQAVLGDNYFDANPYFEGVDSDGSVQEETSALYVNSMWELEFGDYYVQINAGARYEETDVTSLTRQQVPQQVNWVSATEWITQYEAGDNNYFEDQSEHSVFLPNFDLKLDVTDDLVARVSWGKTMARAPLGNLAGGQSLSGSPKIGARTGGVGNTSLQPFKSTNLDLSLEYYYGEASYASIGYFKKDVQNFISIPKELQTFDGLHDIYLGPRWNQAIAALQTDGQVTTDSNVFNWLIDNGFGNTSGAIEPSADDPLIEWTVNVPINLDERSVDGIEVAIQHMFGESGFGFSANATFVDGDVEFDQDSFEEQSPLNGLSDSANLQTFYEKDGLSVKLTYAWRDEYLIGVGQDAGSAGEPQFAKAFAQLDLSVNYDLNEKLTVFFEGINLNNETEEGFGRYEEQFMLARQYGPRYILGARYSF
jgi:TonB-dependent receptor